MKLLYIHANYIDSEQANVVQAVDMAQAFARCGVDVTLALGAPRKKLAEPESLLFEYLGEQPKFQILTYPKITIAGRLDMLGNFWGLRSLVRNCRADMCFVDDPLSLRLCLNAGLPTVFEVHNSHFHNRYKLFRRLWEKDVLFNVVNPKLLKFITISRALADSWRVRGVPDDKIVALHDGFNEHVYRNVVDRIEARKLLDLPVEHQKIVVYAGNLQPDRGIERIIHLAKEFPNALFVIVGGPEKRRRFFVDLSKSEGVQNIIWIGHIPHADVVNYLYASDILLMLWTRDVPTINVCSPLKVFEYMASEKIIVGDAFPTIKEVLIDGVTAHLSNPDSFADLRTKLDQALHESYPSEMANKAREIALAEYSWNKRAQKILLSVQT